MYNIIVVKLEKELINKINSSGLHIATIKLILEKLLRMVNDALEEDLRKESTKQESLNEIMEIDESLIENN